MPTSSSVVAIWRRTLRERSSRCRRNYFWGVATDIARAERLYPTAGQLPHAAQCWYECMARLDFLPNSPTLMNAGRRIQQFSACFLLPVEDSLGPIYDSLKHQAFIHQSGRRFRLTSTLPGGAPFHSTMTHILEELRRLFVTAHDVSSEHHVRMQAVFQR